ncbi:MAG TPA: MopE-related protein, partial [Myxococcota bacterium]|nr:MopE-related protein [Myxococcota bacterium]
MRYAIPFTLYLVACGGGVNTGGNKLPESKPEELDKPEIELEVTSLDFGHVDYGQLIPGSVTVTNLGEEDLVVESISTEAPFYVSPSNMTLQGGASGRITVNVQLVAYGAFSSAITIVSNDEDEGTLTVDLSAAAIDDVDQDGHALLAAGGDDCNDEDADVYPGADEVWYNGVDENCDGANDYDQDGDGYETDAYNTDPQFGGGDCQDVNTEYHPGAPDVPYDNRDTNCLGDDDW